MKKNEKDYLYSSTFTIVIVGQHKHKIFYELGKESKIIFWKRFEQFLDFVKIKHIKRLKIFSTAVGKIYVHSLTNFKNFFTLGVFSESS